MAAHTYDTLIVGAGFTGIGAAIKLTRADIDDIVILERGDRVGGTWRDNTYPGAACDVPSLLYSFSFVSNSSWSRAYSPAGEIRAHIEEMVSRFALRDYIRFGVEVNGSAVSTRTKVTRSTARAGITTMTSPVSAWP
jgi:cation diffusion facilitator CzcD-associated flavoprotein CzcO